MTLTVVDRGSRPIQVIRTVEPVSSKSCEVTAEIFGGPGGLMKLLEPVLTRSAQKSIEGDYDRLVQLLESANTDSTENSPSE